MPPTTTAGSLIPTTATAWPGSGLPAEAIHVRQLSLVPLVGLHLVPGALGVLAYLALAGPIDAAGYPPLAALLLAVALVILPVELAILWGARSRGRGTDELQIPYRQPTPHRVWAWLVPVLLLAALLGSGVLMPADNLVAQALFGWLPTWYLRPIDVDAIGRYSATAWALTLAAYLLLNGVAGPIVEELYFRGWLLPRMARFGRWAPVLNTVLFSLYHFWTPWQFLSRVAAVAPFVYAVWWRRNMHIGMIVHILLNLSGGALIVASIAGRF
jgi:membrane protease YdiL (CAAX protease family)